MTPLQQKFLKAIDDNIDNIGYGDIDINYNGAAKASEQICIEEKIELLNKIQESLKS